MPVPNAKFSAKDIKKIELWLFLAVSIVLANLVFRNAETTLDYVFRICGAMGLIAYHIAVRRIVRALPPPPQGTGSMADGASGAVTRTSRSQTAGGSPAGSSPN